MPRVETGRGPVVACEGGEPFTQTQLDGALFVFDEAQRMLRQLGELAEVSLGVGEVVICLELRLLAEPARAVDWVALSDQVRELRDTARAAHRAMSEWNASLEARAELAGEPLALVEVPATSIILSERKAA